MSTETPDITPAAGTPADRVRVQIDVDLEQQYRHAVLDRSVSSEEYASRLKNAERAIIAHRGTERSAVEFMATIDNEIDNEIDINDARMKLQAAFDGADQVIREIRNTIAHLSDKYVYDVEIADGDTDAMAAALAGMRLNLAALRHLTRNATPEEIQP